MVTLRKIIAIFMVVILGVPLGIIAGVIAFIKFPIDLLQSTLKSIDKDAEFEKIEREKLAQQGEKDIWERHIERMNKN